jgi:hypothetical protein
MATKQEFRSLSAELRAESQGDEMALVGYAALFNSESKDLGGYKERIVPGAFTRSLREGTDVKALINHSPNQLLGRVKNGTLKLEQDSRGLKFRCLLNANSQAHRDLYASIKRGDMDECSFAFSVAPGGDDFTDATDERGKKYLLRTLKDVSLSDISCVTYPAYSTTSVDARSAFVPDYTSEGWLASKKRFLANVTEQINRDEWTGELLNKIMSGADEQRAAADRELEERMKSAAGITTR